MDNNRSHIKTSDRSTLRLSDASRLTAWLLVLVGFSSAQAAAAAENGALSGRSQGSVTIRVSVSPRVWMTDSGTICSNLPSRSYGLRANNKQEVLATVSASPSTCSTNTSSVHALKVVQGLPLVIVVPE